MEGTGNQLVNVLLDACEKAGVELMTETRGTRLLTDDNGAIVGVLATQGDKELEIHAKSVVIAPAPSATTKSCWHAFILVRTSAM
jgi:flavin-dependent dehydrogenase